MNWHEWLETNELSWMNWNERIEMKELTWMNWNERIEMKELTGRNELNEWNELIHMNELTWMTWNESTETNELPIWVICGPHLEKVVRTRQFLTFSMWSTTWCRCGRQMKWSSPYSRAFVDLIVDLIFKKFKTKRNFLTISMRNQGLALQSRAHFVDLISKKRSEPVSFLRFLCEIELSLIQSRAHFVDHFPDRGAHPQKQRPSSGDHGRPLYLKKRRVFRPRVFSAVNSRVPDRSHFSTTSCWCGWHDDWDDDVVAMMVRQLAIANRPSLGSFLTKLPLNICVYFWMYPIVVL